MRIRLVLSALVLLSLACKTLPFNLGQPAPGKVLFQDNFTDSNSGWNRVTEANGETNYADGVYRILVNVPDMDIWARPNLNFNDVRIEVDSLKVGGDRNNRYGVICRLSNGNNFYAFMISSDGYYGIGKVKGDSYQLIGMDALQPSEAINQGSVANHIRADCAKDRLALYVNGKKLAEVQDTEFASGDVGLIAGTYTTAGTDIRFSNFRVLQP